MPRFVTSTAICFYLIGIIDIITIDTTSAFIVPFNNPAFNQATIFTTQSRENTLKNSKDDEDVPSDAKLLASLQSRLAQINTDRNEVLKRWRKGKCSSSVRLSLDDWVRRIDVAQWPLAVVGSASGNIYIADLSNGEILVKAEGAHDAQGGDEDMLKLMYGDYDGGGIMAVAIGGPNGRLVATAGREGSAHAWRLGLSEEILEYLGEFDALEELSITCLKIDGEGRLYAGTYEGSIHCIHFANLIDEKDPNPRKFQCDSPILSIDVCEDIDLVTVGTSSGAVYLFSTDEDMDESEGILRKLGTWIPKKGVPVRSISIAPFPVSLCGVDNDDSSERDYESEEEFSWSLVSGGNDGYMHSIPLCIDKDSDVISQESPLGKSVEEDTAVMQPPHNGPVMCISYRKGGILLSGAQDGTIRVWDSTPRCTSPASINQGVAKVFSDPRCLYGLGGYKVWLGSICTGGDGLRLISDGADNTVIVHNFSLKEEDDIVLEDDDDEDDDDDDEDEGAFM